jgi:hypothetical protein
MRPLLSTGVAPRFSRFAGSSAALAHLLEVGGRSPGGIVGIVSLPSPAASRFLDIGFGPDPIPATFSVPGIALIRAFVGPRARAIVAPSFLVTTIDAWWRFPEPVTDQPDIAGGETLLPGDLGR